jgi:hypothetical protein
MSVVKIPGLVIDETNGAAGDNYYEIDLHSEGCTKLFLDMKITDYTVTIEANVDAPYTTSGERWTDITSEFTGGPATVTASDYFWLSEDLPVRKIRIKYVRVDATNELEIRMGKMCK